MSAPLGVLPPNQTPLLSEHQRLCAKIGPFAGWQMPIQYSGIIEEHMHTRTKASIFDVCHMGEFIVHGVSACDDLERLMTLKVSDMAIGRCRYGFLLNKNGGIIDDLLLYRLDISRFMVVVNAGTFVADAQWIVQHLSAQTCFEEVSEKTAKIDLQGPLSAKVFEDVFGVSVRSLLYYSFITCKIFGIEMVVSRTGYTGELGFEIFFDSLYAVDVWKRLLAHPFVKPAGLGARDTLRLEMGYPLYGNEITHVSTPFEACLGKFVHMEKEFIGKDSLTHQLEKGGFPVLVGFKIEGKRSARKDFSVYKDGIPIGTVTSASFSPSLGYCVGLASLQSQYAQKGQWVDVRSDRVSLPAQITPIPFYTQGTVRVRNV